MGQTTYMNSTEALLALYAGQTLRQPDWPKGEYIYMADDGDVYSSSGELSAFYVGSGSDVWEVSPPLWLSTGDVVSLNENGVLYSVVWANDSYATVRSAGEHVMLIEKAVFCRDWRLYYVAPTGIEETTANG